MPNSKVYEKQVTLPSGGIQQSYLSPTLGQMANPILENKGNLNPTGAASPLAPRANLFADRQVQMPTLSAPAQQPQPQNNYIYTGGDETQNVFNYLTAPSEEEQKLSKQNESKKRLLLLTDAIRHLGNLYNTTQGATPQQFTSPVVEQENIYQTERQRRQRERSLAVNQALEVAKQRADEEYKNGLLGQKQAELERKGALDDLNIQLKLDQQKALDDYRKGQLQLGKENLEAKKAQNAALNKLAQQRINLGYYRANTSSAGKSAKDKIEIKSYDPNKTMMISKDKLNDATFKSDTRSLYNRLVKSGKITPVTARQYDKNSGEYKYVSKNNPSLNEMLEAIQEGSGIVAYMEWANKYADEPLDFVNKSSENRQEANVKRRENAVNKSKGFKL